VGGGIRDVRDKDSSLIKIIEWVKKDLTPALIPNGNQLGQQYPRKGKTVLIFFIYVNVIGVNGPPGGSNSISGM